MVQLSQIPMLDNTHYSITVRVTPVYGALVGGWNQNNGDAIAIIGGAVVKFYIQDADGNVKYEIVPAYSNGGYYRKDNYIDVVLNFNVTVGTNLPMFLKIETTSVTGWTATNYAFGTALPSRYSAEYYSNS
ncbi:hypothetical protein FACS18949_18090 [Clostridia bacterium]|nr:hypothetical protein FACS18949_18090 [Clostridia bacterium]